MTETDSPSTGYEERLTAERSRILGYYSTTNTYQYDWCEGDKTPEDFLNDRNKPHLSDIKTVRRNETDLALDRAGYGKL